jgi:hypothetical protein
VAAGGEAAAVAEDAGRCSDPDAGHRDQDLRKRAGFEEFLHAGREKLSLVKNGLERDGEAEDDQRGSLGAGRRPTRRGAERTYRAGGAPRSEHPADLLLGLAALLVGRPLRTEG